MLDYSMTIGGVDLQQEYGIVIEEINRPFLPKLRPRKVELPNRSGAYDYGAKWRDEISLDIKCGSIRLPTQSQVRELVYTMSEKTKIAFWDEPDKYYIGRIYDPGRAYKVLSSMRKFELSFICDPFAYGATIAAEFERDYSPSYIGTAPAPARLQIKNVGSTTISGIHITITRRKETYQ